MLAAHSIPANSSGDFKPVQLGDGVSPASAVSDPHSSKVRDESVLVERRATFSARLRAARESNSVSLEQIAASSKINVALLKALESGNVARWPKGLYRRSYLRDYLRAVGLPVEPTVADFVRLFPDEEDQSIEMTAACEEDESPALAMTLEANKAGWRIKVRRHAAAAIIDAGIVLIASGALRTGGSGRLLGGACVHRSCLLFSCHHRARPQPWSALGSRSKPAALEDRTIAPCPAGFARRESSPFTQVVYSAGFGHPGRGRPGPMETRRHWCLVEARSRPGPVERHPSPNTISSLGAATQTGAPLPRSVGARVALRLADGFVRIRLLTRRAVSGWRLRHALSRHADRSHSCSIWRPSRTEGDLRGGMPTVACR